MLSIQGPHPSLTYGNVTAQADNGQHRYVAQDRTFVFLVEATSSYASIAAGMHAFLVPRALFMDSMLKARLDANNTWPLGTTEFYAEDTTRADMSEAVTAVTAGQLTGSEAYWLLQYLRQNTTGDVVYEAVDVTAYVPLLNLPADAVNIVPWAGVTNGPTGEAPSDFWDWLGGLFVGVVNGLLKAGQLLYGGLIAIGTFFVALGEAIVDWGMQLVGTYQAALAAVQEAVQKAADVLMDLVNFFVALVSAAIETLLQPIAQWTSSVIAATQEVVHKALAFDGSEASMRMLATAMGDLILVVFDPGIMLTFGIVSLAVQAAILASFLTGIGAVVAVIVVPMIISAILSAVLYAVAPAIQELLGWIADLVVQGGFLWTGFAVAILTLSSVLLSRISAPVNIYKTHWAPPTEWWATGYDVELVGEKVPNKSGKAIMYALASAAFAAIAIVAKDAGESAMVSAIVDAIALAFAALGLANALEDWAKYIFGKVTLVLSGVALAHSTIAFVGDLDRIV